MLEQTNSMDPLELIKMYMHTKYEHPTPHSYRETSMLKFFASAHWGVKYMLVCENGVWTP